MKAEFAAGLIIDISLAGDKYIIAKKWKLNFFWGTVNTAIGCAKGVCKLLPKTTFELPQEKAKGLAMGIKIGELAKISGLAVGAIRFYEKAGIIGHPERSAGNYRLYGQDDIERLRFAKHCREQGLSLEEIRILLAYKENPSLNCAGIHEMIDRHIASLDSRIEQLRQLRDRLVESRKSVTCDGAGGCGIINMLRGEDNCQFCSRLRKTNQE